MKKGLLMFTLLAASLSGAAHADSAAIKQSLAKLGVQSTDIQPSPASGMSTVLTDSGVLYVTDDGKHIIQGPMYDVSGAQPVNVTNQLLLGKLNALSNEMIVYKAPKEQHVITVFTDITCGYCHKLHEQMSDYNALGITVRYLAFPRQGLQSQAEQDMKAIWCAKDRNKALDDAMNGKGVQPHELQRGYRQTLHPRRADGRQRHPGDGPQQRHGAAGLSGAERAEGVPRRA